jgi:hypothetical protein
VNQSETAEELSNVLISLADENGEIQGRRKKFKAAKMASFVEGVVKGELPPNLLTREYGIRQQAIYIRECEKLEAL